MSMTESKYSVEFDQALLAAANRACAAYPQDAERIVKGTQLVRADAVTDYAAVTPYAFTVQSATDPERRYSVSASPRSFVCTCADFTKRQTPCKHIYSVWLMKAARKDTLSPRLRHMYHASTGEEGQGRCLADGRVCFHPGGRKASFVCMKDEVYIGPYVNK